MMGWKIVLKGGGEWDCVTKWRKMLCYMQRAGVTHKIKRQIRRRLRHQNTNLCRIYTLLSYYDCNF